MILFEQALNIVLQAAAPKALLPEERCEYIPFEACCGRVLQQTVSADRNMPPFDKSAVDGYACKQGDLAAGVPLRLLEIIPAGVAPKYIIEPGTCSKIMTGAMVPEGADGVLMVEDALEADQMVRCAGKPSKKTNICLCGEDVRDGTVILIPGILIQAQHLAILAAVGCTQVRVAKKTRVAVVSTGDELVEPFEQASAVQIRNSNSWQVMAQAVRSGADPSYYGIARDSEASLRSILSVALKENEIVVVSGGVSMGDFDLVPKIIKDLGINILFNKVAVQPGKPTTFGTGNGRFFFGLPGNPVSSFVQFELMARPLISQLMGAKHCPISLRLPLARAYRRKHPDRMAHLPARIDALGRCELLDYNGSGHITALHQAQGLARIPLGISQIDQNEPVALILL